MKINELTGYKNNPLYKSAQDTFDGGKQRYSQLVSFTKSLEAKGFKKLGNGQFATVFEHPNYPWVFKVFTQDPAYLFFLKYVIRNQTNPHVPKVRGGIVPIGTDTYVIRMEKLSPSSNASDMAQYQIINILGRVTEQITKEVGPNMVKWLITEYPDIYKMIRALELHGYRFDMHDDNIMLRGDTVVVTDPLVDLRSIA